MQPHEMDRLIARHFEAEAAGDAEADVAVNTDDIVQLTGS